jgi:hypothetical protein
LTESERIVRKKLALKRQAAGLMQTELQDLRFDLAALRYRDQLARRIQSGKFDTKLSARLDRIQTFLDRGLGT